MSVVPGRGHGNIAVDVVQDALDLVGKSDKFNEMSGADMLVQEVFEMVVIRI